MKKLVVSIAIAAALMMASAPTMAQVFLSDLDGSNNRGEITEEEFGVMVPTEGVNYDQFTPVGSGVVVLAGLAGTYLLGKRRKDE